MSSQDRILKNAAEFVKAVVEKDFKQKLDGETLQRAAAMASKAIPTPSKQKRNDNELKRGAL
jgi:hypothetical protein